MTTDELMALADEQAQVTALGEQMRAVTFRQSWSQMFVLSPAGNASSGGGPRFNRGESASFPARTAEFLVREAIAVWPGQPLDPPPPDTRPTQVRVLQSKPYGAVLYNVTDVVTMPRHDADQWVARGWASFDLREPPRPALPVSKTRAHLLKKMTQLRRIFHEEL